MTNNLISAEEATAVHHKYSWLKSYFFGVLGSLTVVVILGIFDLFFNDLEIRRIYLMLLENAGKIEGLDELYADVHELKVNAPIFPSVETCILNEDISPESISTSSNSDAAYRFSDMNEETQWISKRNRKDEAHWLNIYFPDNIYVTKLVIMNAGVSNISAGWVSFEGEDRVNIPLINKNEKYIIPFNKDKTKNVKLHFIGSRSVGLREVHVWGYNESDLPLEEEY